MKTRLLTGLLLSLSSAAIGACGQVESVPSQDPPVAPAPETNDGPKEPVTPAKPAKPASCGTSLPTPQCSSTQAAPDTTAAITQFVKDDAIPIRCGDPENARWDLAPLVQAYGDKKIFMMGEVHGTNEIGIVSSLVFEELASKDLVNVLGFEMPMDLEPMFQHYVDTGSDYQTEQMLDHFAPNMFGSILTKTAADLVAKGKNIRVGAVDTPYGTEVGVKGIQAVAAKLTSQTQKDNVLLTLPTNINEPATADDLTKVNAYFDHIMEKKTEICAELSEADCDRLDAMTHALWVAATSYERDDEALWFERREVVIYYNMRTKMPTASDRMFLHMGAFHTNKHEASAGSRMSNEYALTKGQVFSIAPAYGTGSVIWYGGDVDLEADPTTVTGALSDTPQHPFFVSTNRPSTSCVANPLGEEMEGQVGGGTRGQLYDGYIHYGVLTSERRPTSATLTRGDETDGTGGGGKEATGASIAAKVSSWRARVAAKEAGLMQRLQQKRVQERAQMKQQLLPIH
jgi:hypothetical protein